MYSEPDATEGLPSHDDLAYLVEDCARMFRKKGIAPGICDYFHRSMMQVLLTEAQKNDPFNFRIDGPAHLETVENFRAKLATFAYMFAPQEVHILPNASIILEPRAVDPLGFFQKTLPL